MEKSQNNRENIEKKSEQTGGNLNTGQNINPCHITGVCKTQKYFAGKS